MECEVHLKFHKTISGKHIVMTSFFTCAHSNSVTTLIINGLNGAVSMLVNTKNVSKTILNRVLTVKEETDADTVEPEDGADTSSGHEGFSCFKRYLGLDEYQKINGWLIL